MLGYRYVNPEFTQGTGYTPRDVKGKNPRILKSGETPPDVYRRLWETTTAGQVWRGEFHNKKKDGSLFWEAACISPIGNAEGIITHFIGIKEDMTDRKRTEEQLRQNGKLATMGQLLAGVAHEVNNPLATVAGQASLLCTKAEGGPLADRAKEIMDAAAHCGRIVKNFLTLAGQHAVERQEVHLNAVVHEAVELLAYHLRADTVEVTTHLAPDIPPLWADPHQLHQVLVNLITNAHHAIPSSPPSPPAKGPGWASPCARESSKDTGGIRVESEPGRGAVFRIEFPADVAPPARAEARAPAMASPVRGKTILVVDDEPLITELLGEVLSLDGHQVEMAPNGMGALEKLRERSYDLILSDLKMSELDGPGLYRAVEAWQPQPCGRFLFVTGDILSQETREFLERTGVPSLTKPFALEDVRRAV